jgi:hypothetical protein
MQVFALLQVYVGGLQFVYVATLNHFHFLNYLAEIFVAVVEKKIVQRGLVTYK